MAFYNNTSPEWAQLKANVEVLTEETPHAEKLALIQRAVRSGSITLLHRVFGRQLRITA